MRWLLIIAICAAFSLMSLGIAAAQVSASSPMYMYDPIFGKTPDKSVKNWIRLVILRPRTSLTPIFFISPDNFDVAGPEKLILLSKKQYGLVARRTRTDQCARSNTPASQQFLGVTEYPEGGSQAICRMTRPEACRYLNSISKISEIGWENTKWELLRLVHSGFGC